MANYKAPSNDEYDERPLTKTIGVEQAGSANVDYIREQRRKAQTLDVLSELAKETNLRSFFIVETAQGMGGWFTTKKHGPYTVQDVMRVPHLLTRHDSFSLELIMREG